MPVIDSNDADATAGEIDLINKTIVSLYVFRKSGTHKNRQIGLELSPDGDRWVKSDNTIKRNGFLTITCAAAKARAFVSEPEGRDSKADVILVAR